MVFSDFVVAKTNKNKKIILIIKMSPQPCNYVFDQISIDPVPAIFRDGKLMDTTFTTLEELKRGEGENRRMSLFCELDETKSNVGDELYEYYPEETNTEGDSVSMCNEDNDSKSVKSEAPESPILSAVIKRRKEKVKKKETKIAIRQDEMLDFW